LSNKRTRNTTVLLLT